MKKVKILIFFCLTVLSISCYKDIDFNQVNQLVLKPTYVASILKFNLKQTDLFNKVLSAEIVELNNTYELSFTERNEVRERVEKMVLDFEFENPFDREFNIEYSFFNANNEITYPKVIVKIPANIKGFKHQETVIITNNPNFFGTTLLASKIQLLPSADGSKIDVNEVKEFNFTLSGTFYLKLQV